MEVEQRDAGKWQDELYDLLRRNNVTQFAYVPDAGHRILIDRSLADPGAHSVALTTEEEGVALLAGADLGGARGVLLMQSSGAGNCINMLSLIKGGHFPLLALVSMRGDFGEGNPWQFPMGQAVEPVLETMGVICLRVERPEEVVPTVGAGRGDVRPVVVEQHRIARHLHGAEPRMLDLLDHAARHDLRMLEHLLEIVDQAQGTPASISAASRSPDFILRIAGSTSASSGSSLALRLA